MLLNCKDNDVLLNCFHTLRVEDHDDLTPIFNRQSDMLKTTYGDYFLAELIESQDEDYHAIIVEVRSSH